MAETFYTLLTNIGMAKIANAQALGTTVNLTHIAVGDGNGAYYNPTASRTALAREVWRGQISSIDVDADNPNWIVIDGVIPTSDGGFMVREAGVFDGAGDLIAIGKYPETYKPVVAEGSAKDLYIRLIIEVSNATTVTLKIDPAVVLATKINLNDARAEAKSYTDAALTAAKSYTDVHENKDAPHSGHETPAGAQAKADAATGVVANALVAHEDEFARYKSNVNLEFTDLRMQLEEANVLDFINKTGVGFYDLFQTTEYVDTAKTTATVDTTNKVVKFGTPSPSPARATVTLSDNPGNGDTLTIGDITYIFKTVISAAYDVAIGPDLGTTVSNLTKAIMLSGTAGVNYGTGTLMNDKVVVV
ncbi:phage tail protein [Desulfitobacterium chlororespirans]|uniref:Phage tail-collar fibre protein n=1 Tax=Desulfitobacterium chlororespirans DSM 11544 TaxID=1121395 RepID=A0A1M7U2L6_9FIRM|nr:phage tail protein [Desulfitobacterium chlororespirans]SHN77163.1 Phage tail-collar fibre protein [Desulfitobacterium chlororespirans DSM 11544]